MLNAVFFFLKDLSNLTQDQTAWTKKCILNIAASGKFSSDRAICEYAKDIWNVTTSKKKLPDPYHDGFGMKDEIENIEMTGSYARCDDY